MKVEQLHIKGFRNFEREYQQELNLHYVGVTRAINACYMLVGSKRFSSDGRVIQAKPSSFLSLPCLQYIRRNTSWSVRMPAKHQELPPAHLPSPNPQ